MEMQHEVKDGVLVIYLNGHLLGAQANAIVMGVVFQNIEAGTKKVVFNLKGVNYVDSAGLGLLLSAVSKIKNAGGQLIVCNLSEQVVKLFKTTKVESVFKIGASEDAALETLRAAN